MKAGTRQGCQPLLAVGSFSSPAASATGSPARAEQEHRNGGYKGGFCSVPTATAFLRGGRLSLLDLPFPVYVGQAGTAQERLPCRRLPLATFLLKPPVGGSRA